MKIILPCKCHSVCPKGFVYTKFKQFSKKGVQGIQTKIGKKWIKLKTTRTQKGYLQAIIHYKTIRVNRLIATSFIKNPLSYPEVHHINGDKLDNRILNLRWGTPKMNAADRRIHGNQHEGSKSPNAKLTEYKVKQILIKRSKNVSLNILAREYGVSKKLILLISQGKVWKHVRRL